MSQFGSGGGGGSAVLGGGCGGTDFHLPDEILAVIPTDPYEQLDLARKITSLAIASRVSTLETDVDRMRQRLYEKEKAVCDLQEKVSHLQRSYQEVDSRLKTTLDDNLKLSKERDSLAMTVKKLNRDLSKLEAFKRQLMQSLSDDNSSAETVDIGTCDQTVPQAYPEKGLGTDGHTIHHSLTGFTDKIDEVSKLGGQRFSFTPYITPRLTPTGTPKFTSTSVSPRSYSVAATPQRTSAFTSPTKSHHDRQDSISSWFPTSQQSSAANSPPRGRPIPGRAPRIDGKEFFRQARSRLSYEQFSAFLANIKELNAQKQTREETLRKAEEIFGIENKDLFLSFQGLLNRNMR